MTPFNLEWAIAAWRRSLTHRRELLPEDVEELAQHVRDQVAGLVVCGWTEEAAFREAMQEMGGFPVAEAEYRKVYWRKLINRKLIANEMLWQLTMFKSYIATALRSAWQQKGYTFINVFGLGVGLAACLLIFLFVQDEERFDRHIAGGTEVYRVLNDPPGEAGAPGNAVTPPAFGPVMQETFPEVVRGTRLYPGRRRLLTYDQAQFYETDLYFADTSVFDVFALSLLHGNPATALQRTHTIVLTERMARKYFGETDPMGKMLLLDNRHALEVTGILPDPPPQAHLQWAALASFETLQTLIGPFEYWAPWVWQDFFTYVRLAPEASVAALRAKLPAFVAQHARPHTEPMGFAYHPVLQPLHDIHLHSSDLQYDVAKRGSATSVQAFSLTALIILLIACFNFINLATARAARRAKEVGVRKVVGAHRSQLVKQFLSESLLHVGMGLAVALALVWAVLPAFNDFAGKTLHLSALLENGLWAAWLGVVLFVGVLAGSYPAFYLARFDPVQVLKGRGASQGVGVSALRKVLVTGQFALSVALILATVVIGQQMRYLQSRDLGFEEEQVVYLYTRGYLSADQHEAIKQRLLQHPNVVSAAASWGIPGDLISRDGVAIPGHNDYFMGAMLLVDHDYIPTFGMEMIAGRAFSRDYATDAFQGFVLNEQAVRELGWTPEEALGKPMQWHPWGSGDSLKTGHVIGVVQDFHLRSLREAVEPTILHVFAPAFGNLSLRLRPENLRRTLDDLAEVWAAELPQWPFSVEFLDEQLAALYESERKLGQLFFVFAVLAIGIACLGLLGLAAFAVQQRTKEVGIRRVLGASGGSILRLLSREFLWMVGVAFLFAAPLAYYTLEHWLSGFAYRAGINLWLFAVVGLLTALLALATVATQALRALRANPVQSLRSE